MTRLISLTHGTTIDAMGSAVPRLLASGFFRLADGEPMPEPKPEPKAEPEDDAVDEGGFAFGAFAEDVDDAAEPDLSAMTRAELVEYADSIGIEVPNRATKAQIASLIEEAS